MPDGKIGRMNIEPEPAEKRGACMDEPVKIVVESTPNPNSAKFVLNRTVVEQGSEFYETSQEGDKSLLAQKMFKVPGVKDLFLMKNFVSLSRDPGKKWEEIVPKVEEVLREHFK
jgi:hypothetical protein